MEKSKIVMGILAAATLGACQSSKVKISGRLVGADARQVYIEQLSAGGKAPLIDSVSLDDAGNYRFELKNVPSTPSLYTISYNGESVPVLIEGGDRLTINSAGSFARNYTVEGNEESSLLREFNLAYVEGAEKLNDIAAAYARNGQSEEELKRLAKAYSDEYLRIKRAQLAFIVEHKASIAAVYALSQRLPGDRYLFNGQGDAVYYRTVADALEERYPQSPYLASLHAEISRLDALQNLSATVSEAGFPDLEIADMYGKKVRLSSLEGNVVLIDFWSPSLGNSNALNADLKQLYEKYHDSGFEVYQVAVETSKPMWINTVQEQSLPWISVCDLRGEASPALTIYNVRKLPANYLIDRKGDIVAKDLYYRTVADALEERYPQSPYLASLHAEISRLDALQNLSATVSEAGFPDLEIADMYGKKVRLSSLEGNVVLIDFWSPSLGNSNALNADLKQLYEKYHDSGFEVYQVAVETSKPMWINTVQEQSLPWISVCDLRGEASPALTIYNVRKLPANYLIDRKGDIVAKDLYGTSLEQQLEKLL